MKKPNLMPGSAIAFLLLTTIQPMAHSAEPAGGEECYESRKAVTQVTRKEIAPGRHNVQCSDTTGAVLFWGDPFDETIPMGAMPLAGAYSHEEAVVKPREPQIDRNKLLTVCTMACHDPESVN